MSIEISLQERKEYVGSRRCEKNGEQKICVCELEKGAVGQEKRFLRGEVVTRSYCPKAFCERKCFLPPSDHFLSIPLTPLPPTPSLCGAGAETEPTEGVSGMKLLQGPQLQGPFLCLYSLPRPSAGPSFMLCG